MRTPYYIIINVNKVSSRMTLWFDVANSPSLSREQNDLVMRRLKTRIGKDGILRVISLQTRNLAANRESAEDRFVELVREVLRQGPMGKRTRVIRAAKLRRLREKKQHSLQKEERSKKVPVEE